MIHNDIEVTASKRYYGKYEITITQHGDVNYGGKPQSITISPWQFSAIARMIKSATNCPRRFRKKVVNFDEGEEK